jgi:hypothetical protein
MKRRQIMNKLKTRFLIAACSLILMALPDAPARALARQSETNAFAPPTTAVAVQRARRYGPYATLRRANEVANYARRNGYKAKIYYGGVYDTSRVYYVDVWR